MVISFFKRLLTQAILFLKAVPPGTASTPLSLQLTFDRDYLEKIRKNISGQNLKWEAGPTSFFNLNLGKIRLSMQKVSKNFKSKKSKVKESKNYFNSVQFKKEETRDFFTFSGKKKLPESFNRTGYLPGVTDQGFYYNCTAHAVASAVSASARIQKELPVDSGYGFALPRLSPADIFFSSSEDARWNSIQPTERAILNCVNQGILPASFDDWVINDSKREQAAREFDGMRTRLAPEVIKVYSKRQLDYLTGRGFWEKPLYKNDRFKQTGAVLFQIFASDPLLQQKIIKHWLILNGPVVAKFIIPDNGDIYYYKKGVYSPTGKFSPRSFIHSVCIAGYDDEKGAWLCRNSWGKQWGEAGDFWIEYGVCSIETSIWGIGNFSHIYEQFDPREI